MKRMNNRQVAAAFAKGATVGRGSNLFINGDRIYSYGHHFTIAERVGNIVKVTLRKYSVTTSKHTSFVLGALANAGATIQRVASLD